MIFNYSVSSHYASETLAFLSETKYSKNRPMGNVSLLQLHRIVGLCLIGMDKEVKGLLPDRLLWIETAIDEQEEFGGNIDYHLMELHSSAAVYSWMITSKIDSPHWHFARIHNEIAAKGKNVYSKNDLSTERIDEYMLYCYFAGEYNLAIIEFEKIKKLSGSDIKILFPRDLVYALCLHKAARTIPGNEILSAGRKVMRRYLQSKWIGAGRAGYAAMWLSLLYGVFQPELSPREVILKAYDDMPKVERPAFVNE
ncbi:hypothetical protein [Duganella phyllosphaerae]|uniref:Uncharacterized protein n=1 Tax=Duganella phyllosphaerae TaxID=762836 RepID=A0A1E7WUN8_9BURK|nr:hypothetical protein [Duganella phyllosphaerae]OFA03432.1 hypothetical protein DUPY_18140 [Duganella phyllosphaerae]